MTIYIWSRGPVICLSDLGNILAYYLDKTTHINIIIILSVLLVQVICQNITVPNITTETYTKYNN